MSLSRHSPLVPCVLLGLLAVPALAQAQTTLLTLPQALERALLQNPDLANQRATLANARADLAAKQADPSTLIVPLTQAKNSAALEETRTAQKQLEVMQAVISAYTALHEAQENVKVLEAQLALDSRNLEIAKAKLEAKNGTALEVAKAESTLAASRQNLSDAKAQLPILAARLEALLGQGANGTTRVAPPPAFQEVKLELGVLEQGLSRLPSLLQAAQSVELAELNVRLADNDYTPAATLRDARANLENTRRNLETARQNALTTLRDAYRSAQNALEKVRIAQKDLANDETSLEQDQARFASGTISRVQLQSSEVALIRSRYAYQQAVNGYFKALAALSVAAGVDVTGWGPSEAKTGGGS
jgi:outer membrane protein